MKKPLKHSLERKSSITTKFNSTLAGISEQNLEMKNIPILSSTVLRRIISKDTAKIKTGRMFRGNLADMMLPLPLLLPARAEVVTSLPDPNPRAHPERARTKVRKEDKTVLSPTKMATLRIVDEARTRTALSLLRVKVRVSQGLTPDSPLRTAERTPCANSTKKVSATKENIVGIAMMIS
jgi:hypothetical protein